MPEVPKLPPLRQVNHKIPLKNPNLKITHRPAKCPEPLRDEFREEFDRYVKARSGEVQLLRLEIDWQLDWTATDSTGLQSQSIQSQKTISCQSKLLRKN
jgi:hypothetical protein